jgi:hypothetical protein
VYLRQNGGIFLDVLEYVERSNDIKFVIKWYISSIHLHEFDGWETRGSEEKPLDK